MSATWVLTVNRGHRQCQSRRSGAGLGNARNPAKHRSHRLLSLRKLSPLPHYSWFLRIFTSPLWYHLSSRSRPCIRVTYKPHGALVPWSPVSDIRHSLKPSAQALWVHLARVPRHRVWRRLAGFSVPTKLCGVDRVSRLSGFDGRWNAGESRSVNIDNDRATSV